MRGALISKSRPPDVVLTASLALIQSLFDALPDVAFWAKDRELRFLAANAAALRLCGVRHRQAIMHKTVGEFLPDLSRRRCETWEQDSLRTNAPVADRLWLCTRRGGRPVWLLHTVWPIGGGQGAVVGIASVARTLRTAGRRPGVYERLATALDYIHSGYGGVFDIGALADLTRCSISQLERDFVALLGLPPSQYLTKVRMDQAMRLLGSDGSIGDVAHACGYADQSAFARRFKAATGMSPSQFRRSARPAPVAFKPRDPA